MPVSYRGLALGFLCMITLALCGCLARGSSPTSEAGARYTVADGDTLLSISARFDVPENDIYAANHLHTRQLNVGESLIIPGVTELPPMNAPATAVAAPTVAEPSDTSWYIPRSSWSSEHIDTSNILPMTHIFRITIHHSGDEGDIVGDPEQMLRHFEHIHTHNKGWACIGYHFIIAPDGRIFEGRPLKYQGAHATGDNNIGNIGICLIGDFDRIHVPAVQKAALLATLDRLTEQYGIDKHQIFGHREFKPTDCPGRYLMAVLRQYRGTNTEVPVNPSTGGHQHPAEE
jgi:hypothetical protein